MGMREILGYAPVQPDGSVQVQVPANVPFTIDVLDANARRITVQHTSWLQVMPGEIKSCNGCHTAGNPTDPSHGRSGLTDAVNTGRSGHRSAVPRHQSRAVRERRAKPWRRPWRASAARPAAPRHSRRAVHAAVLADPRRRRGLSADLDPGRHAAPGGHEHRLSVRLERHRRHHHGYPEHAAHQSELHAVERAVPHHHPLCERELQPDGALHSKCVEHLDPRGDRQRRREHFDHVHQLPQYP